MTSQRREGPQKPKRPVERTAGQEKRPSTSHHGKPDYYELLDRLSQGAVVNMKREPKPPSARKRPK